MMRCVPTTAWARLRLLSLTGFMVPALFLFAMAGTFLPWSHWILILAPLPVLAFGRVLDRDSWLRQRRRGVQLGASALMPIWALGALVSLSADPEVPSIVWLLWTIAALTSLGAVFSTSGWAGHTTLD